MKNRTCLSIILCLFAVLLLILGGCGNTLITDEESIYNFMNYESSDVRGIERVKISNDLSRKCMSYKFTYMSDGYEVKAYISIPLSFEDNQVPINCLLYNRGGNSRIGLLSDEDTAKICAETNRIVIASQYRGAAGGQGKDEFGGDDINDVIKLIDLCENHFSFIDMEDFCAVGVSRGGMMSYLAAREDKRVKRIVAISAVSDLFKSYEEREDMQKLLTNYIGTTPEESPDEYEKRSAVYWTEDIKVPVLIIHSRNDEQVSFAQAQAMYDKLKQSNENVSFVAREDSVHGLSVEDTGTILDWLNK